jgi:DNA-binding IclR family transcriptional regulator
MKKKQTVRTYSAPALTRGLRILEFLSTQEQACSQREIARALGHTHSEIFRLLSVLEQEGYLLRDASGDYSVSLKLFQAGIRIDVAKKMIQAAREPMRQFSLTQKQESHLSVLQDGRLIVLAQQTSGLPLTLQVRVGSAHDPRKTVSGRLLLAQLESADLEGQLRHARAVFPGPHPARKRLEQQFEEIRQNGYSTSENESITGVSDMAVLVGAGSDPSGMAALASSRLNLNGAGGIGGSILENLRQTAEAIGRELSDLRG